MRIGVLGASGIGKFHVREFKNAGCEVVAILGRSRESAEGTAEMLMKEFGIEVRPYFDLDELLGEEMLDAISICTPPRMHAEQVKRCLEQGLHVFCEKPFVDNSDFENFSPAKELIELSVKKSKIISVNTQWVSIGDVFKNYLDLSDIHNLEIFMEPGTKGKDMLKDFLPHANSVLIKLCGRRSVKGLKFIRKEDDDILLEFRYALNEKACAVKFDFKFKADRPRGIMFSINGNKFIRKLDKDYNQSFVFGEQELVIEDPFKTSIQNFVNSVEEGAKLLVSQEYVLENVKIQDIILKKFEQDFSKNV